MNTRRIALTVFALVATAELTGGVLVFLVVSMIAAAMGPQTAVATAGFVMAVAAMICFLLPASLFAVILTWTLWFHLHKVPTRRFGFLLAFPAAGIALVMTAVGLLALEWITLCDLREAEMARFLASGVGITALITGIVGQSIVRRNMQRAQHVAGDDSALLSPAAVRRG